MISKDYSYTQDTNWTDKIATWDYTATNTLTFENSGPNYNVDNGIANVYLHEMNRSTKSNTTGEWDTVSATIGLMYASDYALSLGETASTMTGAIYTNRETLKIGWMYLRKNDSVAMSTEWTMSRIGVNTNSVYYAWVVILDGSVNMSYVNIANSARPVFYLTSDVKITGEGTSTNPYIIC